MCSSYSPASLGIKSRRRKSSNHLNKMKLINKMQPTNSWLTARTFSFCLLNIRRVVSKNKPNSKRGTCSSHWLNSKTIELHNFHSLPQKAVVMLSNFPKFSQNLLEICSKLLYETTQTSLIRNNSGNNSLSFICLSVWVYVL